MCGLAGLVSLGPGPVDLERVRRMGACLAHRGPDDAATLLWAPGEHGRLAGQEPGPAQPTVAVTHRRLAVLDLSTEGRQPMVDDLRRTWLAFNGEVYNYLELRRELEAAGDRFRSGTDTEVVLAAWRRWGVAALHRFRGMWALAVLDTERGILTLARDPFGIKPLYWAATTSAFAFASEVTPLLEIEGVSRRVDAATAHEYLRFGLTDAGDRTFFQDVHQLPAGHVLELPLRPSPGSPCVRPVVELRVEPLDLGPDEAASALREAFLRSVELHLRSDRRVGAALSGGIDSSAVVMAMREVGGAGLSLDAVTWAADDPDMSELRWATQVADAASANLHVVTAQAADLVRDLDALVRGQGQPFGSTSIYAQHRVFARAADEGLTVMLDGQGADELLAGYRSALAPHVQGLLRRGRLGEAAAVVRATAGLPGADIRGVLLRAGAGLLPRAAEQRLRDRSAPPAWLDARWSCDRSAAGAMPAQPRGGDALRQSLLDAVRRVSVPSLLRYEDRSSMIHSIESRVPFLSTEFAELALGLPPELLVRRDGTSKAVFRDAMRGLVPDAVLDRRDKVGFATPERRWFALLAPWMDDVLSPARLRAVPALDADAVRADWAAVQAGRAAFDWRVWRWVNAVRWSELFGVDWA